MRDAIVLFLDFDGVLHSRTDALGSPGVFGYLDALVEALEPFPEVVIMVSSSWRLEYTLTELKMFLGPLGKRVVGTTHLIPQESRYEEIRFSMCKRTEPWLAIDDDDGGWPEGERERLIHCDPTDGLGDAGKAGELVARLTELRGIIDAQQKPET